MGRRGPQPTPTSVLAARGSWRAKARQESEPPRIEGVPERPSWLTGEAKRLWENLVEWLDRMGVLSSADVTAMARYCQYWHEWTEATKVIRKKGYDQEVVDKNGNVLVMDRPEVARHLKLGEQLDRLEKQFGLTPASRASIANSAIGKKEEKPKSAAEAFLKDIG